MTHRNIFLPGAETALALAAQSTFGLPPSHPRRRLGLGKWMDGPGTPIDCSLSLHDYDYYLETCWDGLTMWWINGRCVSGNKQEVSELHRCHNPDGSRPYCHDCNDGRGNVKNVCGADSPDYDLVCDIAWAGDAKNCGTEELTTYSHQCLERSGGTESWYIRESYECDGADGGEVDSGGPCGEDPEDSTFECGDAWYYPFEDDDPGLEKLGLAGNGEHPFSDPGNRYCLSCGLAIAVCASDADATCEDLGLPKKGEEFDTTAAPFIAPRPEFTNPPVLLPALEEMEKGDISSLDVNCSVNLAFSWRFVTYIAAFFSSISLVGLFFR